MYYIKGTKNVLSHCLKITPNVAYEFGHFLPIFVQFKSDLSGNTFFTASFIIGIFDLIVNLARFARIIETFPVMF